MGSVDSARFRNSSRSMDGYCHDPRSWRLSKRMRQKGYVNNGGAVCNVDFNENVILTVSGVTDAKRKLLE
ncbi:unnamed protein product [Prunus armeniaca]|uniref:Uncharacterized protein n=1 Tax=Prunus armeniaca TaxID=36596 RepID=A0A6J5W8C9_PRUAR|nr:unnamed protein product [Prunus armeniaca]